MCLSLHTAFTDQGKHIYLDILALWLHVTAFNWADKNGPPGTRGRGKGWGEGAGDELKTRERGPLFRSRRYFSKVFTTQFSGVGNKTSGASALRGPEMS